MATRMPMTATTIISSINENPRALFMAFPPSQEVTGNGTPGQKAPDKRLEMVGGRRPGTRPAAGEGAGQAPGEGLGLPRGSGEVTASAIASRPGTRRAGSSG